MKKRPRLPTTGLDDRMPQPLIRRSGRPRLPSTNPGNGQQPTTDQEDEDQTAACQPGRLQSTTKRQDEETTTRDDDTTARHPASDPFNGSNGRYRVGDRHTD